MSMNEHESILDDLDDFVEVDLSFDSLTEFIVDVAEAVRSHGEMQVSEVIRSVMTAYRCASGDQDGCDTVPLAEDDRVSDMMHRNETS